MYNIRIDIGENSVTLMPTYGYYVAHIDGLTGISANFNTVKAVDGYGESITGKTIPSKSLVITGVILDGNTTAKQNLLNVVKAGAEGVITIYKTKQLAARPVPYRRAKIFVKQSPVITQEKHSKFSFTLTMPNPYWEDVTEQSIPIHSVNDFATATVSGDVPPALSLQFTLGTAAWYVSIYCASVIYTEMDNYFMFDFTRLGLTIDDYPDGLPANTVIKMWWDNGRLRATATYNGSTVDIVRCVYTASKLWKLPLGSAKGYYTLNNLTNATLKYRPLYTGVLVDGV